MTTTNNGPIVSEIISALQEIGPMTAHELSDLLGVARSNLQIALKRMRRASAATPKRIYVKEYQRELMGERRYPRAVYALGCKSDAKPPGPEDRRATVRRYKAKLGKSMVLRRNASVFHLGLPAGKLRLMEAA